MTSMIMKEIGADFNTENSMEIVILIINEKSKNIVYKMTKDYKINPPLKILQFIFITKY